MVRGDGIDRKDGRVGSLTFLTSNGDAAIEIHQDAVGHTPSAAASSRRKKLIRSGEGKCIARTYDPMGECIRKGVLLELAMMMTTNHSESAAGRKHYFALNAFGSDEKQESASRERKEEMIN